MLVSPARNQSSSCTMDFSRQLLGRQHREAIAEIEAHLMAEHRQRAGPGPVGLFRAVGQNTFEQVVILIHLRFLDVLGFGTAFWRRLKRSLGHHTPAGGCPRYSRYMAAPAFKRQGRHPRYRLLSPDFFSLWMSLG